MNRASGHVQRVVADPPAGTATPSISRDQRALRGVVGLAVWAALVAVTFAIGASIHPGYPPGEWLPPLHATRRALSLGVLPALVAGLVAAVVLPTWFARLSWRRLLFAVLGGAIGWAVVLAVSDGWRRLVSPIASQYDYLAAVPGVGSDPIGWLDRFAELVPTLPTHPSAHPPLPVLLMWLLDAVGLGGANVAAAVCIGVGASSAVAVLVTLRAVVDEATARRAAPFLTLAPFALTVATSFDALFAGFAAWAVAALAVSLDRRSLPMGVLAGGLLVSVLYLNYGLVVMGAIAVAVVALRWVPRVALGVLGGGVLVGALFTLAGFWWFDGVRATYDVWSASHGGNRPYGYTVFGNLAVLALLVGPATAVAVGWVRDRRLAVLGAAAAIAVLSLDLAGFSRGEVERIWLPFAPWVMVATAALPRVSVRTALVGQVLLAVIVQLTLRLRW